MSLEPGHLLKELDAAWAAVGKQENAGGVLRACSMTLVALTNTAEDPQALGATLADLMHEFPNRTVLLRLGPEGTPLEGRVAVQCWVPAGGRQQICSEQIEIDCGPDRMKEAARALLGLTVPDLPVTVWATDASWLRLSGTGPVLRLASKVIVDGTGCESPAAALGHLRAMRSPDYALADLAWTRITRWRQVIYQELEARAPSRLDGAVIRSAGAEPTLTARYLAAWLRTVLPAEPELLAEAEGAPGRIRGVRLWGPGFDVSLDRPGRWGPPLSLDQLLHAELSVFGRDTAFERVLDALA